MKVEINILNKKIELIQWLSNLNDLSVIEKIIEIKRQENKAWWNSISDAEKASIEKGIEDADNGKVNPHSKAKKLYEKWL